MTITTFQSFPAGIDDSEVKSWPIPGHVEAHANGGPNNRPYGRYFADGSTTNGDGNIRVHDWGIPGGGVLACIQPGQISWRHIAIEVPSGQTNPSTGIFAGDEVHQSSQYGTTGPAPVNLAHDGIGNRWYYVSRGANARGLSGAPFNQVVYGRSSGGGWPLVNFVGGAKIVVADKTTFWLIGTLWDYTGNGWVEIWYADEDNPTWANIVPRHTGVYTCFNNQNFPMSSLYAGLDGGSGTRALKFANGFYGTDYTEALSQANSLDGLAGGGGGGPVNTTLPTITGTPQQSQTLTGIVGTWSGASGLTHQWEWDQASGLWTPVSGATSLSFFCSPTFVGAQVRLRETADGTVDAVSDPVSVTALGGTPVFRLYEPLQRTGGSRTANPSHRIAGLGGGGL